MCSCIAYKEKLYLEGLYAGLIGVTTVDIKIMDIVGRRSYKCDIIFRVIDITRNKWSENCNSIWRGFSLSGRCPYEDLVVINQNERVKMTTRIPNT